MEKYFANEQLQTLRERAAQLGAESIKRAENEWAVIIPAVMEAMERGDDPESAPEYRREGVFVVNAPLTVL